MLTKAATTDLIPSTYSIMHLILYGTLVGDMMNGFRFEHGAFTI
jgi:hypothetical protein